MVCTSLLPFVSSSLACCMFCSSNCFFFRSRQSPIPLYRKRAASTSSTPNSNPTSPSLTISNPLKLKKRSIRSSGVNVKTRLISSCPPMVRILAFAARFDVLHPSFTDKTIKLWKVFEKSLRIVSESNHTIGPIYRTPPTKMSLLQLPQMSYQENIVAAVPRKVYANAHAYHIHSISVNSDQETYISADDLRINLWNLNISDQSFSESCGGTKPDSDSCLIVPHRIAIVADIVDIKPVNMEELTEVITATEFHPSHCNLFMYSSSKANIKLADMRDSALCDKHAKCEYLLCRIIPPTSI